MRHLSEWAKLPYTGMMPDPMTYILSAIFIYLVLGLILTRNVLRMPRRRMRFWDVALGAVIMPVLSLILFLCIIGEDLWKRLLIALDLNPPEEMRAGPKPPTGDTSVKPPEANIDL